MTARTTANAVIKAMCINARIMPKPRSPAGGAVLNPKGVLLLADDQEGACFPKGKAPPVGGKRRSGNSVPLPVDDAEHQLRGR